MDDGRRPRVQEVEAFENLSTPRREYFQVDLFETPQIPAGDNKTADKQNIQAPDYHSAAEYLRSTKTQKQPPADVTYISHVRREVQIFLLAST